MLILAVDTSTRSGSLALLRDGTVLSQQTISPDLPYSATFSPGVEHLLNTLGMHLGDIDLFAVAAGPGSFTGLRIGLTAAKAWAEAFGKPIAAVSGLEAIAAQVPLSAGSASGILLAPVLDARRGQVFGGLYRRTGDAFGDLTPATPEVVTSADEFVELVRQQLASGEAALFPCPTPETIRPTLRSFGTRTKQCRTGLGCPGAGDWSTRLHESTPQRSSGRAALRRELCASDRRRVALERQLETMLESGDMLTLW